MKRLFAVIALLSASVFAQAEGKVAVIDIQKTLIQTDAAKVRLEKLEQKPEFKANLDMLKKIQKDGQSLVEKMQKDGAIMSDAQKIEMQDKIKSKQEDLQYITRKLQEERQKLMMALSQEFQGKLEVAIRQVVEEEGIGLLLNANPQLVMHVDTSFDISAKVTSKLNKAAAK